MKHLKTYEKLEPEYSIYKVGNYIIWNNNDSWEICEISTRVNSDIIKVIDLYYLEDNELKYNDGYKYNIDLSSDEERNSIKYVSDDLDDCKKRIQLLAATSKYNL